MEWISVGVGMPEIGQRVLAWFIPNLPNSRPSIVFAYREPCGWDVPSAHIGTGEYLITHWMPLPLPPSWEGKA